MVTPSTKTLLHLLKATICGLKNLLQVKNHHRQVLQVLLLVAVQILHHPLLLLFTTKFFHLYLQHQF
jgi:hypothetical protein